MFPESTLTRRLVGTYTKPDGTSFRGSIRFVLTATGMDRTPDALVHYPAIDVVCQLDYQGRFAVHLLCTDDFDLEPENVTYHVYEQFPGGRNYYMWFPYGPGTEIDIMMLAPPAPPTSIPDDGTAITVAQAEAKFVNVEGDIMDGPLTLLHDPQDDRTAVHKKYVDDKFYDASAVALQNYLRRDGSNPMLGPLDSGSQKMINVADPTDMTDVANRNFVENTNIANLQYTDQQDAALRTHSDEQDAALRSYVDQQDVAERTYTDQQDAALKAYSDAEDAELKSYVDAQDAAMQDWATDAIASAHEVEIGPTTPTAPGVILWIEP